MALALVYIIINFRSGLGDAAYIRRGYPVENYDPDGILMLLGSSMPGNALIDAMLLLSKIFPWLLLFGVFSRFSLVATLVTHLFLRTLIESFVPNWSHGFNVVFLAHIGFLFAPVGQRWSVDALVRKWRGRPETQVRNGFWAVVLGQWCVALMFLSAFYWKALFNDKLPFAWAHWENMRNMLLLRYEWSGDQVPAYLGPVLDSPPLLGLMAWGNLIFQFLPILSVFVLHRPVLRLVFGLSFVVEELGLAFVMGLPDLHWLPLIAFFVDWDHFFQPGSRGMAITDGFQRWKKTYAMGLIGLYLIFSLNVAGVVFGHNVYDLGLYPFAKFNMYSGLMRTPGGGPYVMEGTMFELDAPALDAGTRQRVERKLKSRAYGSHDLAPEEVGGTAVHLFQMVHDGTWAGIEPGQVKGLRVYRALHVFRTDTAHLATGARGLMARADAHGTAITDAVFRAVDDGRMMVEVRHDAGPFAVIEAQALDRGGKPNGPGFQADGGTISLPSAGIEGSHYLHIVLHDSTTAEQVPVLVRIPR